MTMETFNTSTDLWDDRLQESWPSRGWWYTGMRPALRHSLEFCEPKPAFLKLKNRTDMDASSSQAMVLFELKVISP